MTCKCRVQLCIFIILFHYIFIGRAILSSCFDVWHNKREVEHVDDTRLHVLEHTENTFRKSHLHIYTFFRPLGVKICVNLHKLCVNYTNLGWREALVDHLQNRIYTFTQKKFHLWSFPSLGDLSCTTGHAIGKKVKKTRRLTYDKNAI